MDYQIHSDAQSPYMMIELSGRFNAADMETCYRELIKRSDWERGTDVLWDARSCSFEHLDQNDMKNIARMTEKYRAQRGPGLAAWVMGRDVDFGMGRMYELINENSVVYAFRVFRSVEKAKEWIRNTRGLSTGEKPP